MKLNILRTTNYRLPTNKGIALILALFSLVFISLLVVVFVDTVTIDQQIVTNSVRDAQAIFLADAGVEYAVYKLKDDSAYDTDTDADGNVYPDDAADFDTDTMGTGEYKVGIPSGALPKTVTATGIAGDFTASVEAVISSSGSSVKIDTWRELEEGV
ncbi:MAG: pilus assembly PilX N-terminal domain-containing protein [Candidatus Omnitrophota bacterium]